MKLCTPPYINAYVLFGIDTTKNKLLGIVLLKQQQQKKNNVLNESTPFCIQHKTKAMSEKPQHEHDKGIKAGEKSGLG